MLHPAAKNSCLTGDSWQLGETARSYVISTLFYPYPQNHIVIDDRFRCRRYDCFTRAFRRRINPTGQPTHLECEAK